MSIYYIEFITDSGKNLFSFDATTEITVTDDGSATSFPLESGEDIADHYVNSNITVSFSGRISDIKARSRSANTELNKSTETFLSELRLLKKQAIPFKIYMGSNIAPVNNCVFESLNIKQDRNVGTKSFAGRAISSFDISFTAKQIRFGSRAETIVVRDELIVDITAPERPKADQKQELSQKKYDYMNSSIFQSTRGL